MNVYFCERVDACSKDMLQESSAASMCCWHAGLTGWTLSAFEVQALKPMLSTIC